MNKQTPEHRYITITNLLEDFTKHYLLIRIIFLVWGMVISESCFLTNGLRSNQKIEIVPYE